MFHSYGNFIITGKGLCTLTYARHSWSLSIEDSLECHTYSDMGHPFIMVIFEDPWHCRAFSKVADTTCFRDLALSRGLGFEHPNSRSKGRRLRRDHINVTMLYNNVKVILWVYLLSLNICSFLSFCLSYPPVVKETLFSPLNHCRVLDLFSEEFSTAWPSFEGHQKGHTCHNYL